MRKIPKDIAYQTSIQTMSFIGFPFLVEDGSVAHFDTGVEGE